MSARPLREQVNATIAALGDSADQIAATLDAKGIRGRRGRACDCPVARYLLTSIPDLNGVYVSSGSIGAYTKTVSVEMYTRPGLVAFIVAFDDGAYPQLVASDQGRANGGEAS